MKKLRPMAHRSALYWHRKILRKPLAFTEAGHTSFNWTARSRGNWSMLQVHTTRIPETSVGLFLERARDSPKCDGEKTRRGDFRAVCKCFKCGDLEKLELSLWRTLLSCHHLPQQLIWRRGWWQKLKSFHLQSEAGFQRTEGKLPLTPT